MAPRRMIGAGADNEEEQMPTRRETAILFSLGLLSGAMFIVPLWLFPPAPAMRAATGLLAIAAVGAVTLVGR